MTAKHQVFATVVALIAPIPLMPLPADAQGIGDPHLNALPRSAAETTRIQTVTAPPTDFSKPQKFEAKPAGAATVPLRSDDQAFAQPSANLDSQTHLTFRLGEAMFDKLWVSSPSSTLASDGLGPLYNARSCRSCHVNAGRGQPPVAGQSATVSMVLRLNLGADPDPTYGHQFQDRAVPGHAPEGALAVRYTDITQPLSDGETVTLRQPVYSIADPAYGPVAPNTAISPRIAPQMIGLGLLEAIPSADILAAADPDDLDGDGISGRARILRSKEFDQDMLGRFGWKAAMPSVKEQSAAAFSGDIGLSSPLFPAPYGDCTEAQPNCITAPHGDQDVREFEIDAAGLDVVTFYSQNLAVPARRDVDDPHVLRGKQVFHETGCATCHQPAHVTHRLADQPAQSFQLIWPYTDLLLHDMGEGLADTGGEQTPLAREWRTPPLWGIGSTKSVSGHSRFLHDGRARSLLEAVLWHGGEAQAMKDRVVSMPKPDRDALIRFLESL